MSSGGSSRRGGPPRAFDPSMRAREAQLFDDDRPVARNESLKAPQPFRQHLLETRGAPIPTSMQLLLWAVAAVVAVLFCLAVYRMSQPRAEKPAAPRVSALRPSMMSARPHRADHGAAAVTAVPAVSRSPVKRARFTSEMA